MIFKLSKGKIELYHLPVEPEMVVSTGSRMKFKEENTFMTANWKETLAANLARLRREKGLTQAELGEKLNYSDKSVSKWERGEGVPDLQVMVALSELYGVSIDEMTGRRMSAETTGVTRANAADRTFLMIVTQSIIWLLAIILFSVFLLFAGDMPKKWLVFIYAIPVSCLCTGMYFTAWKLYAWAYGAFSCVMWLACVASQLTLGARFAPMIYILGAILQLISVIVIGILLLSGKKRREG
ncbi:MAG: helix-turn-helix transcriptional regulator [Clostridia bacterium]|nr:helix-turn-helix transcriptional regulator [Clostridia bacterium]MBQ5771014.1 helix-turn-helix transcriptional regulator [Clostridia bacterium]